jgi:hypothetical protein
MNLVPLPVVCVAHELSLCGVKENPDEKKSCGALLGFALWLATAAEMQAGDVITIAYRFWVSHTLLASEVRLTCAYSGPS